MDGGDHVDGRAEARHAVAKRCLIHAFEAVVHHIHVDLLLLSRL